MSFMDELESDAERFWDQILNHPMVQQLGAGTLPEDPFRYWLRQDYVYLIEYNRLFALGAARAPSLDLMGSFSELLDETLHTEMELHRSYAGEFGISERELEATTPSPTTRAYTDFLVRTAALDRFDELVAALLPCMWGFNETGVRLREAGLPDHPQYRRWIAMYSSPEFTELAEWCRGVLEDRASKRSPDRQDAIARTFRVSAQYEYLFWEAAWTQQQWPLEPAP